MDDELPPSSSVSVSSSPVSPSPAVQLPVPPAVQVGSSGLHGVGLASGVAVVSGVAVESGVAVGVLHFGWHLSGEYSGGPTF